MDAGTRRWPGWADSAIAAALAGLAIFELSLTNPRPPTEVFAGAVVMAGALAWRRRRPVTVLVTVLAAEFLQAAHRLDIDPVFVPLTLYPAFYAVGAHRSLRPATAGLLAGIGALALQILVVEQLPVDFLYISCVATASWGAGAAIRARVAAGVAAESRARRAEEDEHRTAAAAVAAERARIARELHDVVAHSVSVMVMQAGALRRLLGPDHRREVEIAQTVERTGREALTEMRRMLQLLRDDDGTCAPLTPQPGLARLDELVERTEAAGVPVTLRLGQSTGPVPPGVDLCAFRIVQESLTNVIKHAGSASACVEVRFQPDCVEVEVVDDGRGGPAPGHDGHGLLGMRERVGVFGGQLDAGPRKTGGFAVRARLPLAPS